MSAVGFQRRQLVKTCRDRPSALEIALPNLTTARPSRRIPKSLQVRVFERDTWMCRSCRRPVVFAQAMKLLANFSQQRGAVGTVPAYYHAHWTRTNAPLLDELGACVDHIVAHAKGGSIDFKNLATLCSKCNMKKGSLEVAEHLLRNPPPRKIRARYGEPTDWDGLSGVFVSLANEKQMVLNRTDREWLQALMASRDTASQIEKRP
jgi:5-methylcytosine-specific restriction endonuclease McrA